MADLVDYNGFDNEQRMAKFRDMNRQIDLEKLPKPQPPCELCGETDGKFEYHDEDYSEPYSWIKPAAYGLCHHCHIHKIHARFRSPNRWFAFLAHVRRGGHSSDLYGEVKNADLVREFEQCCAAFKAGKPYEMAPLTGRRYEGVSGHEWFSALTVDASLMGKTESKPRRA